VDRELGFRATAALDPNAEQLAGADSDSQRGRKVNAQYGTGFMSQMIAPTIPLAPDG
jgi:hypothetical protein